MDLRYWDIEEEKGYYAYAEFSGHPAVLAIIAGARGNLTALGYWRDVAYELAALVDEQAETIEQLRKELVE